MAIHSSKKINNSFYSAYGERWYSAYDDPVALLRAESKAKLPWILERIPKKDSGIRLLDIGCGGGFLSNALAARGMDVTGIDQSKDSLDVAARHDASGRARYLEADANALPFSEASFDIVTCLDMLEHVEDPKKVIEEAARVLRPGGRFFFHTFNRNLISYFVVIKGVEWLVKNCPANMHLLRLFIKPKEMRLYCERAGLQVEEMVGLCPKLSSIPLKAYFQGTVPESMEFRIVRSTCLSYLGWAKG